MDLNTSAWRYFSLTEIFCVDYGNKFDKSKMSSSLYANINFIGRTSSNNGVTAIVDKVDGVEPYKPGNITLALGGSIGSCFIQDAPFYTGQNVAVLKPLKRNLSIEAKQFIATLIRNESVNNYVAFARELNAHIKTDFRIKLPVTAHDEPDYQFMEDYIKSLNGDVSTIPDYFLNEGYNKACWYMDNIDRDAFEREYAGSAISTKLKLCDRSWKTFYIKELFDVVLAKGDCQKSKLPQGDIPLITSGFTNYGIGAYVACGDDKAELINGNCLTVDMFGYAFYRKTNFYCVSHGRVNILIPKFVLNESIGIFISQVIEHATLQTFSFARMCSSSLLADLEIQLPITSAGLPDYKFMEDYIQSRPFSAKLTLTSSTSTPLSTTEDIYNYYNLMSSDLLSALKNLTPEQMTNALIYVSEKSCGERLGHVYRFTLREFFDSLQSQIVPIAALFSSALMMNPQLAKLWGNMQTSMFDFSEVRNKKEVDICVEALKEHRSSISAMYDMIRETNYDSVD